MMVALPELEWSVFAEMSAAELALTLRGLAGGIDMRRYQKAKRGPKKPAKPKPYRNGGHVSTHKRLEIRKSLHLGSPAFKGSHNVRRGFCVLSDKGEFKEHRMIQAVKLLFEHLHANGILSEKDIDDMMFECLH